MPLAVGSRGRPRLRDRLCHFLQRPLDWPYVLKEAQAQGIGPLLDEAITSHQLEELVPPPYRLQLRNIRARFLHRNLFFLLELKEVTDLIRESEFRQFRQVVDRKIHELPALRERRLQVICPMAQIGEKIQRASPGILEVPGESPEEKIGEMVFRAEVEEHVVHPDGGITVETIKKSKHVFQHG